VARRQKTIAKPVEFEGLGLFSGKATHLRLKPAPVGSGVQFVRVDLPGRPRVPVSIENVVHHFRRTGLKCDGVEVEVVEHMLAALAGLDIDNIEAEIDSKELPAGDGSSAPYVQLIQQAGVVEQGEDKSFFLVNEPMFVTEGDASIVMLPHDRYAVSYSLDYPNKFLPMQTFALEVTPETFVKEVSRARTFGLSIWIEEFKRRGLGKGITNENSLIVHEDGRITGAFADEPIALRYPDECVRHKVLDLLGDLRIANVNIRARVIATKSGHSLNARMVEAVVRAAEKAEAEREGRDRYIDVREIRKILPHRYPMLMLDRVVEVEGARRAVGIKNVTINEAFFQGHWPDDPIMPGVLQLEAMAQLAGVLLLRRVENIGKLTLLVSIDNVRFRRPVVPGDQLILEVETVRAKKRTAQILARARVGSKIVSEAAFKFMLADAER